MAASSRNAIRFRSSTGSRMLSKAGGSGDGQDASRVMDGHRPDLALPHSCGAEVRQEMLGNVSKSRASVRLELGVGADVLAEQDLAGIAPFEQLDDQLHQLCLARGCVVARPAEQVEFEVRSAVEHAQRVVDVDVRVCVADDDAARVQALFLQDSELVETDLTLQSVCADRQAGATSGSRHRAEDALLARAYPGPVGTDLADDAGADPGPSNPVLDFGHDLVGELVNASAVDASFGWIEAVPVPARAHDDVDPAAGREVAQPSRVAGEAARGGA